MSNIMLYCTKGLHFTIILYDNENDKEDDDDDLRHRH